MQHILFLVLILHGACKQTFCRGGARRRRRSKDKSTTNSSFFSRLRRSEWADINSQNGYFYSHISYNQILSGAAGDISKNGYFHSHILSYWGRLELVHQYHVGIFFPTQLSCWLMAEAMDNRDDQSIDVESYFKGKLMISLLDSWGVVHSFCYM